MIDLKENNLSYISKIKYVIFLNGVRHPVLFTTLILIMAVLDMIGVASIFPFIAALASPENIETNKFLNWAYEIALENNIQSEQQFLVLLGLLVFVLLLLSLTFKGVTVYFQTRFTLMHEYYICRLLLQKYLRQPYSWFFDQHSADLGKSILSEVNSVTYGVVIPLMTIFAQGALSIGLVVLLLLVDPRLASLVSLGLGGSYLIIYFVLSRPLAKLGIERFQANKERFNVVTEAFSAVKEIKLTKLESVYIERYSKPALVYARGMATAQAIAQIPRSLIEAIAFGGLLLVTVVMLVQNNSLKDTVPTLILYGFAGYRLLPALQQIYVSVAQLRFAKPALESLYEDLNIVQIDGEMEHLPLCENSDFDHIDNIELKNITFKYTNAKNFSVSNLNLNIKGGSIIGFIGKTGSGKTTTVDLILGLLTPESGSIIVNGSEITRLNRRNWQSNIGYVPQQINLIDATVEENIAFGVSPEQIDKKAVRDAAKIAHLHEFVLESLPLGYKTEVGERGTRLSGGQRQRIGIARALYNKPKLLVLDEATSALDNVTEHLVMEALKEFGQKMTIIIVAHRLTTLKDCTEINFMNNGAIESSDDYEGMRSKNELFFESDETSN